MNLSIVPYNSSFGASSSVVKVENDEEDKLPNSYLNLLNEEPTTVEKPTGPDYVVKKVVLPTRCNVVTKGRGGGGGNRTMYSESGSCKVKPSIRVQSRTNGYEAYGSSSKVKVPVGKRSPRGKSSQRSPSSRFYTEKLGSWNEVSYINKNCDFYSELNGNNNNVSSEVYGNDNRSKCVRGTKSSNSRKKSYANENKRRKKIEKNIRALGELLPHETADASESIMDDVIAHVKLLQLQMKELSRSRLGGEPVSHPMISIEGFGHYIQHEKMKTKPLEEVIGDLLANDFDAAARFFESKGLFLMPLSSVQGFP